MQEQKTQSADIEVIKPVDTKVVQDSTPAEAAKKEEQPAGSSLVEPTATANKTTEQQQTQPPAKKQRYKGKGYDAHGRPRNFYNPPGKVLRHLAQQNYYDNFYGNQGQFYQLKQKYKTQMCKHFMEEGSCPLQQFCQFAHGPSELRQPNDPLPKNFGKTALGAVHSNYKTQPCKNFEKFGECKFGEGCSFYHQPKEQRKLIDPLPNLPEGVTLPIEPPRNYNKNYHYKQKNYNNNYKNRNYDNKRNGYNNFNQSQANQLMITSLADLAAFGGFNPNKYLNPTPPAPVTNTTGQQTAVPPHMVYAQQQMQIQMYQSTTSATPSSNPGQ